MNRRRMRDYARTFVTLLVVIGVMVGYMFATGKIDDLVNGNKDYGEIVQQDDGSVDWGGIDGKEDTAEGLTEAMFTFVDIGQGDSTIVQIDGQVFLIDAGPGKNKENLMKTLNSKGVKKIDHLILTHPHEDHIGGAPLVLEELEVDKIYRPIPSEKNAPTSKIAYKVEKMIVDGGYKVKSPQAGEVIYKGNGVEVKVVNDTRVGDKTRGLNEYSISLLITHGKNKFLFTGDGEKNVEADIVERGIGKVDVFHAGHHGSTTSNSKELLDAIKPNVTVISSEEGNSYGHPHDEVVQEFNKRGIEILRTDTIGTIVLVSDGVSISQREFRQ